MKEFNCLDDLLWQIFIDNNLFKGNFYYVATLNDTRLKEWLKKQGYEVEIKDHKYILIQL